MNRKLFVFASVALLTLLAGCLGSDDEGGGTEEPVEMSGMLNQTGTQTGLAQIEPELIEATIPITLDFEMVTGITINISVEDNDDGTDPDQVQEITLTEEDGNTTGSANGGAARPGTPFTTSLSVEWDGKNYMGGRWNLVIPVSIVAGPDQWPGPLIWNGVPDRGFSYEIEIAYHYHQEEEA